MVVLAYLRPFISLVSPQINGVLATATSWVLLAALTLRLLQRKSLPLLKLGIVACYAKIVFMVVALRTYGHYKDPLTLTILAALIVTDPQLRQAVLPTLLRLRWLLVVLALAGFLAGFGSSPEVNSSGERAAGLWDLPQYAGYALIGATLLLSRDQLPWKLVLLLLSAFTGSRTVILAAAVCAMMDASLVFLGLAKLPRLKRHALVLSVFATLGLLMAGILSGPVQKVVSRASENMSKLVNDDPFSDTYANGRVFLQRILVADLRTFTPWELVLGRSRTQMDALYAAQTGHRTWPHNDFLASLYCHGILGLALFIYFVLVSPVVYALKTRNRAIVVRVVGIACVIGIMAIANGFAYYTTSYLFVLAYGLVYEQEGSYRNTGRNVQPV